MAAFTKYPNGARRATFWLPLDMLEQIATAAHAAGVSQTDWVQRAIREKLTPPTDTTLPSVFG